MHGWRGPYSVGPWYGASSGQAPDACKALSSSWQQLMCGMDAACVRARCAHGGQARPGQAHSLTEALAADARVRLHVNELADGEDDLLGLLRQLARW